MSLRTYALATSLAVGIMLFPSYTEAQRRQTFTYHKSPYNGAVNVCNNGKCTNVTSYANGVRAETATRAREIQNQLRNRKPAFTIKIRR